MSVSADRLNALLADLQKQRAQLQSNLDATAGGIQLLEFLIKEAEAPAVESHE